MSAKGGTQSWANDFGMSSGTGCFPEKVGKWGEGGTAWKRRRAQRAIS